MNRPLSMSRGGSRRGGERGDHPQVGPDGWAVAGGPASRPATKAGDLSKFGKIDKSAPMTFGPSSVFQKGDKSKSRESTIRQGSTNMFSMLTINCNGLANVAKQVAVSNLIATHNTHAWVINETKSEYPMCNRVRAPHYQTFESTVTKLEGGRGGKWGAIVGVRDGAEGIRKALGGRIKISRIGGEIDRRQTHASLRSLFPLHPLSMMHDA